MVNHFLVQKVDIAGKYAGIPRTNWGMTIIAYIVTATMIAFIIFGAVNAGSQPPLTDEEFQDRWEHDPRW